MSLKNRLLSVLAGLAVALAVVAIPNGAADAATSNGWTTTAGVNRSQVARGGSVTVTVSVRSNTNAAALVDLEIYNGGTKVFQRWWDGQSFTANGWRDYTATWTVPANEATSVHVVKIGVFGPGWNGLLHWNNDAARITVTTSSGT